MITPALRGFNVYGRTRSESGTKVWLVEKEGIQYRLLMSPKIARGWPLVLHELTEARPVALASGRIAILTPTSDPASTLGHSSLPSRKNRSSYFMPAVLVFAILTAVAAAFVANVHIGHAKSNSEPKAVIQDSKIECDAKSLLADRLTNAAQIDIIDLGGVGALRNQPACDRNFDLVLVRESDAWHLNAFTPADDRGE